VRVKLLVGLSGPAYCLAPGDEHEFDAVEAQNLIAAGFAVPASEKPIQRAVKQPAVEKRRGK
jgi:hypothetical protein